ncbi:MAG: hypothetical protein KAU20_06650 [Nanoarchaeota archaeon]|nr:hypothetical protein [Nanoarchaeota archaeon]
MGESEEIEKLAESLKKAGLATSGMDALDKAKDMLLGKNKGKEIAVSESKQEQKEKVSEIIKEVDKEIEGKKKLNVYVDESSPEEKTSIKQNKQQDLSKFDKPGFDITDSDMKISEIAEAGEESGGEAEGEVMTNDAKVLEQEKDAAKLENAAEKVMTNDEIENQGEDSKKEQSEETSEEEEGDVEEEEKEEKQEELTDEKDVETNVSKTSEEAEQKPQLTESEKDMTDLTKLFSANK